METEKIKGVFELLRECESCSNDLYGIMNIDGVDVDGFAHRHANTLIGCGRFLSYWMRETVETDETTGEGGEWLVKNILDVLSSTQRYYSHMDVGSPVPYRDDIPAGEYFNVFFLTNQYLNVIPDDIDMGKAKAVAIDAVRRAIDGIMGNIPGDTDDDTDDDTEDAVNAAVESIRTIQRLLEKNAQKFADKGIQSFLSDIAKSQDSLFECE